MEHGGTAADSLKSQELYPLSLALNSQNAASQPVAFAGSVLYMAPILILYGLFDEELTQGLQRRAIVRRKSHEEKTRGGAGRPGSFWA